jgi:16S rRNA (cytosine1402-N4)-methyltransferase
LPALEGIRFDGILLDLGISSHQVDASDRGFTFRPGAPLDMRMGNDASMDAAELLNTEDEQTLTSIFRTFGDEPRASRLAREIVRRRANVPFATSDDLVGAIRAVLGPRSGPAEFARLFQAVRIAVNDEIPGLERALPALRDRLTPGGTFVVIAYHSGEDRLVKNAFRDWSAACICPPKQPVCTCRGRPLGTTITRRAIPASADEIAHNPRARSARLRAWRSAE